MTPTQRYWLLFSPGLILMGFFFGAGGLMFFFLPTFFIYQAHRKGWSILKTALLATVLLFGGCFLTIWFESGT